MVIFEVRKNLGPFDRVSRALLSFYLMITSISGAMFPIWGKVILAGLGIGLFLEAICGY